MALPDWLPAFPPRAPLPRILFSQDGEDEEEVIKGKWEEDEGFRSKLKVEGFDPSLIEMGIKVADNHSRSREDALRIGENYIREMSK